jgi:Flp pilus assembly protein TadG
MATLELAACLPVLVIIVLAGMGAVSVADDQVRAQDAAGEVARAEARGDDVTASRLFAETAPAGAHFTVSTESGLVTATVHLTARPFGNRVGGFSITERAVAALEPE